MNRYATTLPVVIASVQAGDAVYSQRTPGRR